MDVLLAERDLKALASLMQHNRSSTLMQLANPPTFKIAMKIIPEKITPRLVLELLEISPEFLGKVCLNDARV